jgi:hypothetical protein|tara:strand:- start:732 stop:1100 length:369 start_codon:yes stop_codon:yes gene_type:complete
MNDEQEIVRLKGIEEKYIELQQRLEADQQKALDLMIKRDEDEETLLSVLFSSRLFKGISRRILDDCEDLIADEIYKFKQDDIEELLPGVRDIVNSEVEDQFDNRIQDAIESLELETRVVLSR